MEAENEKLKAKIGDLVMQIEHLNKTASLGSTAEKSANTSAIHLEQLGSVSESVPSDRLGAQQLLLQAGPIGPAAA